MNNVLVGVDIGGSHLTSAVLDVSLNRTIEKTRQRGAVNSSGSVHEIINDWVKIIKKTILGFNQQHLQIGIAMPGPFDYENGVSWMKGNAKYEALYGKNVKALLADTLEVSTERIRFVNDAAAFLRGEWLAGSAQGYTKAIGLTLGTGLGSSILTDGKVEDANLWCSPFKESIAEDYISTRWFVKQYGMSTNKTVHGVKEIALNMDTDLTVEPLFVSFAHNLAAFLTPFIKSAEAEVVVIGGNIMHNESYFLTHLKESLIKAGVTIPIVRSALGEDAAIFGAGLL